MFRTIFMKWMTTILLIIFTSFTIAGVLLYGFLGQYAVSEKEKTLQYYAKRITEMAEYLARSKSPIVQDIFNINVQGYAKNSNSIILVVDKAGVILLTSSSSLKYLEGKKVEEELTKEVQNGNEIRKIGNFGNIFGQPLLTLGYPIKYNSNLIGSVLINTPLPELQRLRTEVFELFLKSIFISILFAIPIIYFMSRRISRTLSEFGKVAARIASGEYEARVNSKSNDEIGELGRTFNYMAEALGNLEQMRESFIASVSHELRTPLTSINGFVEGIIDGTIPPEEQKYYLSIVKQETVRLTSLANNLLDLARLESKEIPSSMKSIDIIELIRINVLKFEPQVTKKNINVEIILHSDKQIVFADPDDIERVLTNLLDNAVKFTPEMGTIKISTSQKDDLVYVCIEDNGIGIDKEDLPNIWEKFYKSDKSRSQDKTGIGLGLAIIKNIIKKHNQKIWVESELNKGTRFIFTLEVDNKY